MTTTVLLSIKPQYVKLIFDGTKRFEYRRLLPLKPFDRIVIYETSPTKQIVGECDVDFIISDIPTNVWTKTEKDGAATVEHFEKYFKGKTYANAIHLANVKKYDVPKSLSDYGIKRAPQSFCYLEK